MDSKNPVFSGNFDENVIVATEAPMTVQGTLNKLLLLFGVMAISGGTVWYQFLLGYTDKVMAFTIGGLFIGLAVGLIIAFTKKYVQYLSPIYAFAQGAMLGGFSSFLEARFPGIVIQAVSLTFLAVFAMAVLYKTGAIKVTERLRSTVITATFAIGIFYLIGIILSFVFHINLGLIYSSSPLSIALSIFVVGLASFNLLLDFDFVEQGCARFQKNMNGMVHSVY